MKRAFLLLTLLCLAALARADDQTQAVQQALKDQGFYYGTVDGEGGPDTDAAIRRYQIRQGLEVTGKLDAQTLASLNLGGKGTGDGNTLEAVPPQGTNAAQTDQGSTSPGSGPSASSSESASSSGETQAPPPKVVESDQNFLRNHPSTATPAPAPDDEVAPPRAEAVTPEAPDTQEAPGQVQPPPGPEQAPPPPQGVYQGQTLPPQYASFFRKTPYETAPAVVQRSTVQRAQMRLGREGFYRGVADGELSGSLSRAIAAYQTDGDLHVTGRLDMETLDDMNLLPRRGVVIRPPGPYEDDGPPQTVYRGIWIH
jgi:peptidoglycan hydrolase-like protein with peptidoglycan-binding domain